jgi:hypothetical protein
MELSGQMKRDIEHEAAILPIATIVSQLVSVVGVVVTGVVGGTNAERVVDAWIRGASKPESEKQLRFAYRVACELAPTLGAAMTQAWFKGANASLGNRPPALVLYDDCSADAMGNVLAAARRQLQ